MFFDLFIYDATYKRYKKGLKEVKLNLVVTKSMDNEVKIISVFRVRVRSNLSSPCGSSSRPNRCCFSLLFQVENELRED